MRKQNDVKHRDTKQRQIILEAVQAHHDHPRAEEVFQDVCKKDNRISMATVYRNLNFLSNEGKICHVRVPGADRYDSRIDKHYHMICLQCGTVVDLPIEYHQEFDDNIAKETGYDINRHRIIVEGICPSCKAKNAVEAC